MARTEPSLSVTITPPPPPSMIRLSLYPSTISEIHKKQEVVEILNIQLLVMEGLFKIKDPLPTIPHTQLH